MKKLLIGLFLTTSISAFGSPMTFNCPSGKIIIDQKGAQFVDWGPNMIGKNARLLQEGYGIHVIEWDKYLTVVLSALGNGRYAYNAKTQSMLGDDFNYSSDLICFTDTLHTSTTPEKHSEPETSIVIHDSAPDGTKYSLNPKIPFNNYTTAFGQKYANHFQHTLKEKIGDELGCSDIKIAFSKNDIAGTGSAICSNLSKIIVNVSYSGTSACSDIEVSIKAFKSGEAVPYITTFEID